MGGSGVVEMEIKVLEEDEDEEGEKMVKIGSYGGTVRKICSSSTSSSSSSCANYAAAAAEETMLLWGFQQPTLSIPNAFVSHSSLQLHIDACGRSFSLLQSPSSLGTPGVTGAVVWDSGVVLGKFLEHAVDSGTMILQGKKVVELGSGCGLVGCVAALLGAEVILTDLPDRLRLLKKNIETNLYGDVRGSAVVSELVWGEEPDVQLIEPLPNYVLGSDVIYSEEAVMELLAALLELCGAQTTIILAGELRNDAVLEYFIECALEEFTIGRVDQSQWHPDYCSPRVVLYVLVKK